MTDLADDRPFARLAGRTGTLSWFFGVPFRRQSYLNLAYLLLAFPLGLAYFIFFSVGISVGIGLAVILIGFAILMMTIGVALVLVSFERWLTSRLLDVTIDPRLELDGAAWGPKLKSYVLDRRTWSALVYLPVKFLLGTAAFVVAFTGLSTAVAMVMVPLYYDRPGLYVGVVTERAPEIHHTIYLGWNYLLVGFDAVITVGYWEINTLGAAIVVGVLGIFVFLFTLHVCNALAWLWGRYACWSLDGSFDPLVAVFAART